MKFRNLRIILLLICFQSLYTFEIIKKIKSNLLKNNFFRSLIDIKTNYEKTRTDEDDLDSIDTCKNSDYKYYLQYITGYNVTFDKDIDIERAVSIF